MEGPARRNSGKLSSNQPVFRFWRKGRRAQRCGCRLTQGKCVKTGIWRPVSISSEWTWLWVLSSEGAAITVAPGFLGPATVEKTQKTQRANRAAEAVVKIYKICPASAWREAERQGVYQGSADDA